MPQPTLKGSEPMATQVIVVGAGLSGLQAAYKLQQAGIACFILEARDRVGGKLLSVPSSQGRGNIELGGAWTNDRNQPHVMELVKKFDLEMIKQNTSGDCVVEGHGTMPYGADPKIPDVDRNAYIRVRDSMERLCHTIDILRPDTSLPACGKVSVSELARSLGATELVQRIVNIWTSAMLGMASSDVSAVYFLLYCRSGGGLLQMRSDAEGGGQHLRFRSGTQSLCKGLRDCLKPDSVIYSAPVSKIEQSVDSGCIVTTRNGEQYRCSRVISTIPSTLLKEIAFHPPLSADKQWLITNSKLGFYAKLFLTYETPWWREHGLCGLAQGFNGPVSLTRDVSSEKDGLYTLVCFVVGESGRRWSRLSPDQRVAEVIAHVDRIYGKVCPIPLHTQQQIWNNEEFSGGAPCPVVSADCIQSLGHDQWRAEGKVHFAGTETSTIWRGYMEGALTSGSFVASEVIQQLATSEAGLRARL